MDDLVGDFEEYHAARAAESQLHESVTLDLGDLDIFELHAHWRESLMTGLQILIDRSQALVAMPLGHTTAQCLLLTCSESQS